MLRPNPPRVLDPSSARCAQHRAIAAELCAQSDAELLQQLASSPIHADGHGELRLPRSAARVFVKLVPLTALELEPRHRHATANLFGLPTYYQYRMGGHGFGSWRELELHQLANDWVLSGRCAGFPLLHHWRILPLAYHRRDESLSIWGAHPAIAGRNHAVETSTAALVLFLELFPWTLGAWLRERLNPANDRLASLRWAESVWMERLAFLADEGVLHMDAHLENVLTDGSQLFLGDFGLAISKGFALDAAERAFFAAHESFDRCTATASVVHALVSSVTAASDWRSVLREWLAASDRSDVPFADARSYLKSRGPVALAMGDFYRSLRADLTTPYPGPELASLLAAPAWRDQEGSR